MWLHKPPLPATMINHGPHTWDMWLSLGIWVESGLSSADPLGVEAAHPWCSVANHLVLLFLELRFYLVFAWSRTSHVPSVWAMIYHGSRKGKLMESHSVRELNCSDELFSLIILSVIIFIISKLNSPNLTALLMESKLNAKSRNPITTFIKILLFSWKRNAKLFDKTLQCGEGWFLG